VIEEFRASQPDRAIETADSLEAGIRVDYMRISQIFSNLLGTYGEVEKAIGIHADEKDKVFEPSVVNARDPIPPEKIDRLFQPYERGDGSTQGSGSWTSHRF
jgi:sigma-B regulation protein RsbU (phosphoserine phosphatase)